jgi:DNA-binding NarL/FixJ family response regulator
VEPSSPIRVLVLDDHPAVRAGLSAVLSAEPDLVAVQPAESAFDIWPKLYATDPDVIVLDYHLPWSDGLTLCQRVKREVPALGVVLYSAFADEMLHVPAALAGADALVSKGAATHELLATVRRVARGERVLARIAPNIVRMFEDRVAPADLPIFGMALQGTLPAEIAEVLDLEVDEVCGRLGRLLGRLTRGRTS